MNALTRTGSRQRCRTLAALITLALIIEPVPAGTRSGAVRVTVGEPSVWSLEQAHYLLERLRNKNGKIEAAPFTQTDPNAVNSSRLDAVRRLFGLRVEYDQTVGAKNRALEGQYESNVAMHTVFESQWRESLDEQGKVNAALHAARVELARMGTAASTAEDRQVKTAEIAALEKNKAEIEARITTVQEAMGSVVAAPAYTRPDAGGVFPTLPDSMDPTVIKSVLKRAADHQPSLDASAALDNHIQFNYELISKQLTLLRDEVGPGKRILFLELPQTVLGVPGKGDDHLAQSWWRVAGVLRGRLEDGDSAESKRLPGRLPPETWTQAKENKLTTGSVDAGGDRYRRWKYLRYERVASDDPTSRLVGSVRSVELIPRISALNVADTHSVVKTSAFSVIGSFLWGLGAQMNYQKQRETFEQFLQQEVYASGHGKGLPEFGWIFGPKPGSKAIAPGIRTTYAVLVVPDDAAYLELTGRGCQYHRKTTPAVVYPDLSKFHLYQKTDDIECGVETSFQVQVPPVEEGFSIYEIDYMPAKTGERATVILRGFDISPQISVLINGIPLTKVLALGSPRAWVDEHAENNESIRGQVEYLSSNELAFTVSMPAGYVGTPKITLVTPTKAYTLNRLRFRRVAGCGVTTNRTGCPAFPEDGIVLDEFTKDSSRQLFQPALSISRVDAVSFDSSTQRIGLAARGRRFDEKVVWLLNGNNTACQASSITAVTARLDCDRPDAYTWIAGAIGHHADTPETDSYSLNDPYPPVIQKFEVLETKAEVVNEKDPSKSSPATAKILFTGKFFNAKQVWKLAGVGEITQLEFRSSKEVAVSISLKKQALKLEFQAAGAVKDPIEQHFVTIKEWK
ncbi:hypothetical protein [Paludibaculum fermentans]|uniref:hypothetical protein n=1 Tax=Paludibaculum fermentans TaxID=1473598 RepID=UPI003EBF9A11